VCPSTYPSACLPVSVHPSMDLFGPVRTARGFRWNPTNVMCLWDRLQTVTPHWISTRHMYRLYWYKSLDRTAHPIMLIIPACCVPVVLWSMVHIESSYRGGFLLRLHSTVAMVTLQRVPQGLNCSQAKLLQL
jgi:hypothetical protein